MLSFGTHNNSYLSIDTVPHCETRFESHLLFLDCNAAAASAAAAAATVRRAAARTMYSYGPLDNSEYELFKSSSPEIMLSFLNSFERVASIRSAASLQFVRGSRLSARPLKNRQKCYCIFNIIIKN